MGALVSGFMPMLMGWVIALVASGEGGEAAGFHTGFSLLIGTQLVVFLCGWVLWRRGGRGCQPAAQLEAR
ncbi:hypothetical protein D3C80_2121250 [compost metagenome]